MFSFCSSVALVLMKKVGISKIFCGVSCLCDGYVPPQMVIGENFLVHYNSICQGTLVLTDSFQYCRHSLQLVTDTIANHVLVCGKSSKKPTVTSRLTLVSRCTLEMRQAGTKQRCVQLVTLIIHVKEICSFRPDRRKITHAPTAFLLPT